MVHLSFPIAAHYASSSDQHEYRTISQPSTAPLPLHHPLLRLEHSNLIRKARLVQTPINPITPILRQHNPRAHRMQIIDIRRRVLLQTQYPTLTSTIIALIRAAVAVVIEEAVQTRAVDQDILAVHDAQTPALCIRHLDTVSAGRVWCGREDGVVESGDARERDCGVGIGLVVCGLGLDGAEEDVRGPNELVLVESVVLDGGAVEPEGPRSGINEHAATGIDGQLGEVGVVDVMVGGPEPGNC